MRAAICLVLFSLSAAHAQPKRVLYVTHSAGFRHDSIPTSIEVLQRVAANSGRLDVVATEDLSLLTASGLRDFDAVFFFTSGELPISDSQKQDLLAFVRSGHGFGGVHSATDTLYTWPDYGDLIGARFNGHPWVQTVRVDVEDPDHPAVSGLKPSFAIFDEIYQFREFSRERTRVLMTLDTHSADLNAAGVNPGTDDFPLAWCRNYGDGRVFYTALGHFEETWRDQRFQQMMLQALLWLTGQIDGAATPRFGIEPTLIPDGIGNSASFRPRMTISAGSLFSIFGHNLTSGSTLQANREATAFKLAGTAVKLDGHSIPLLFVSPGQVNAYVPLDMLPHPCAPAQWFSCSGASYTFDLSVSGGGATVTELAAPETTPGIFTLTRTSTDLTLWATGLGPVNKSADFDVTRTQPTVTIAGIPARVSFSGLSPGIPGLYQVNIELPPGVLSQNPPSPALLDFRFADYQQLLALVP